AAARTDSRDGRLAFGTAVLICAIALVLGACAGARPGGVAAGQRAASPVLSAAAPAGARGASYTGHASRLGAADEALCAEFRSEWVNNFIKKVYDLPANAYPADAPLLHRAGYDADLHAKVAAEGLDADTCVVPTCFVLPHQNWWEPHCGYRIPDRTGENLYDWATWKDGLRPPDPQEMAMVRARELEANSRVRGCPNCSTRPPEYRDRDFGTGDES
ncbi:MAG: hypothetical protein RIC93_12060, partial [Alphaproteobacteria bacterium]